MIGFAGDGGGNGHLNTLLGVPLPSGHRICHGLPVKDTTGVSFPTPTGVSVETPAGAAVDGGFRRCLVLCSPVVLLQQWPIS
ncbi:hypothetical protein Hanom_Chr04g00336221 [Helianthus anomalus]